MEMWSQPLTCTYWRGLEFVEVHIHSPYVCMAWCLVKHRENYLYFYRLFGLKSYKPEWQNTQIPTSSIAQGLIEKLTVTKL
jgi:hypothetical protein